MLLVASKTFYSALSASATVTVESGSILVHAIVLATDAGVMNIAVEDADGTEIFRLETGSVVFGDVPVNIPFLAENGLRIRNITSSTGHISVFYSQEGV